MPPPLDQFLPTPDIRLSKSFFFLASYAKWRLDGSDPSKWWPVPFDYSPNTQLKLSDETARITKPPCWIYVFQASAPIGTSEPQSGAFRLWRVYGLSGHGFRIWVDPSVIKANPEVVAKFDNATETAPLASFPDWRASTKEQYYYSFYVSRIPLATATLISELESKVASFSPVINLPNAGDFGFVEFLGLRIDASFVPSFDPITIAEALHERYVDACDNYLKFNTLTANMTPNEHRAASHRILKEILGESIKHVIENDPNNDLEIDDRVGTLARIKAIMERDVEKPRATLLKKRNECAAELAKWVNGPAWAFARKSYVDPTVTPKYDREWKDIVDDVVIDRASESDPGKVLLVDWISNKKEYIINEYYLRESNDLDPKLSEIALTTSEKSIKSIMEITPAIIKNDQKNGAKRLVAGVNHMTRLRLLEVIPDSPHLVLHFPKGVKADPFTDALKYEVKIHPTLVKSNPALAEEELKKWFEHNTEVRRAANLIALINFATSLQAAFDECALATTEMIVNALKAADGTGKAVEAIGRMFNRGPKVTRALGQIGAAFGILSSTTKTWARYDAGDYDAAGAELVLTIGSVLELCADLEMIAPVWGLLAAVICVAGTVLVTLFTDTDINAFIKNSIFGCNALSLPDNQPAWSPSNMKRWTDTLEGVGAQIDAFFHLVCGFELSVLNHPQAFMLRPKGFLASSQIQINDVEVTYQGSEVVLKGRGLLDTDNWIFTPDPTNDSKCTMSFMTGVDQQGRWVIIRIDWTDHHFPLPPNQSTATPKPAISTCAVRMDLYGDGSSMLPRRRDARFRFYDSLALSQLPSLRSSECK